MNVLSFARLIGQEQTRLLRELGADVEDPEQPLDETAVVNAAVVGGLIAQRVIHAAFAQAAARDPSRRERRGTPARVMRRGRSEAAPHRAA